jgi:hypothetical protein
MSNIGPGPGRWSLTGPLVPKWYYRLSRLFGEDTVINQRTSKIFFFVVAVIIISSLILSLFPFLGR